MSELKYTVKMRCPVKKCSAEYEVEGIQPHIEPCDCPHGNCDVESLSASFGSASWYCEKCGEGGIEAIQHRIENAPEGFVLGDIKPRGLW